MKTSHKLSFLVGILTASFALTTGAHVDAASTTVMYRLYNPNNHEHFYTASTKERDNLVRIGWGNYEGPAWDAPVTQGNLVYRLYNKGLRDHHYTASWDEVKWLTKNYGWTYEGPAWRSAPKNNHPIYRLFLKGVKTGSHHYTGSWKEVQWLTKNYGWKYEGIGWYGADKTTQKPATPKVNKNDLQSLYNKLKNTKNINYTNSSWRNFQNALNNAKNILNNTKATQNQVNDAKNKLQAAFKGLKKNPAPSINKNDLQTLYNKVKNTKKGDYIDTTWTTFQNALNNAKYVLNNAKATQNQVNDAKNKLQSAFNSLKHKEIQNCTVTVNHVDAQTGAIISSEESTIKAGTTFTANAKPFKYNENDSNDPTNFDYQVIGNNTQTQQISKNTTITFNYNEVHQIFVRYADNYTNNYLKDCTVINVQHGKNITIKAPTFDGYVLDPRNNQTDTIVLNNVTSDDSVGFGYTHQYTVTVNHIDADTNAILSTESKTVYEGENFSTPWKNMTNQNYYLCRNDDSSIDVDTTNGSRSINDIKQNKTITFKYKHISLQEVATQLRQKELEWLNNYRQQNGVGPMQLNDIVQKAADIRAKEVITNFSHYRPTGGTFQDLLEELGCYGGQGENLNGLGGYIDDILGNGASSATDIMDTWTEDEGHKGNLLYANQTIAGISTTFELQPDGFFKTYNVFISANPVFK